MKRLTTVILIVTGLSAVVLIVLLANDIENGPTLIKTSRKGLFLYGVAFAAAMSGLIGAYFSNIEADRFRKELQETSQRAHRMLYSKHQEIEKLQIRLPMSFKIITLEEFRKMWGPDYPEEYKREEGD